MAKEIIWTKRAISKFERIATYLEDHWSFNTAREFAIRTHQIIEIISEHPEIGTLEHAQNNIRGFKLTKHNRLFYRVSQKQIIILNLFDNRRNPSNKSF
ncbi:Plasmid stabilization system protein ParE [Reichenbachiella faecimaris]|uniref:Plasmid stabilization system protein ParE n=1 Tax=Reichenbachiella faecimaris TaxID=692418 RepID=A0A1W2GJD9_REIFA|nr:Plasmid stabilization system protein ParE [Reichenbachiella faecimaris]